MIVHPRLPFAGFATARPWPVTGLTTRLWVDTVDVRMVTFDRLHLGQDHLDIPGLFGFTRRTDADVYPHVVVWRDTWYLEDGHHRVVRAALQGGKALPMRVFHSPTDGETP